MLTDHHLVEPVRLSLSLSVLWEVSRSFSLFALSLPPSWRFLFEPRADHIVSMNSRIFCCNHLQYSFLSRRSSFGSVVLVPRELAASLPFARPT